ncbi:MAG TPA: SEC-C domain-containing protein [Bryobacteraceae bacterium]|nr:SEC-C domain-containing protein [Bryobacteraceae bacterium]
MAPSLTPAQQRALALLSAGSTATAAAQFVGVHRNTVGNWLRSPAFREALIETRRDQDLAWREQARSLAGQALGAIQAVLADPQAPAAARLKAALAVQGRPPAATHTPLVSKPAAPRPAAQPGRNQPCPCGSGRKFKHCCISIR